MPDVSVVPAEGKSTTTLVLNAGAYPTPDPIMVSSLPVATFLEKVIAFLNKVGSYLVDPRTAAALGSIASLLFALGVLNAKIEASQVEGALALIAGVASALVTILSAVLIIWKWLDGISIRPPRGLAPWLTEARLRKNVKG